MTTPAPGDARQTPPVRKTGFTHESQRAATVQWWTPPWIFDRLGMVFDMDPCSPGAHHSTVPARRHLTIEDDGLTTPWEGTVWCNPPYGRETAAWMNKLATHGDGLALVFARTDTAWFHAAAARASLLCFIPGRVRFIDGRINRVAKGSPGAGSVLIAFGDTAAAALRQSGMGLCMGPASTPTS